MHLGNRLGEPKDSVNNSLYDHNVKRLVVECGFYFLNLCYDYAAVHIYMFQSDFVSPCGWAIMLYPTMDAVYEMASSLS